MRVKVVVSDWLKTANIIFVEDLKGCRLGFVILTSCMMQDYYADEVGVLSPNQLQVDELYAGEVGIHNMCELTIYLVILNL